MTRLTIIFISIFLLLSVNVFAADNPQVGKLLFEREVGFSPRRISWAHLPNLSSHPYSESWIDLNNDKKIDLFVFLPEEQTDRVRAFFSDGSLAWEFKIGKKDEPKRELGAFALAAFDIDSDGVKEIICGTNDLRLYALDAYSGTLKKWVRLKAGCYVYSMTVGDVNGDGIVELIVACAGHAEWDRGHRRVLPLSRGYIYALDEELIPIWRTPVANKGVLYSHFVSAGDLDADGKAEVVIPDLEGNFYLLDDDGKMLWAKNAQEISPERQASHVDYSLITDVDGEPKNGNELVIAAEGNGGCVYNQFGQLRWKAVKDISHAQFCAVADVREDLDGKEILFCDKVDEEILLFTSDGRKLWGRKIGYIAAAAGFINWTNDGTKEIVVSAGEYVLIFDEYGQLIDRLTAPSLLSHNGMIANVTRDLREEYIAVMGDKFFVFANPTPLNSSQKRKKLLTWAKVKHATLLQNYPNPFNPETWIPFDLAADATVSIRIYDVKGELVRQLDIGRQESGRYFDKGNAAYWNGKDQLGQSVSSGLYFYMLKAGSFTATRRMVILK